MRVGGVGPAWPDSFPANIVDTLRGMGSRGHSSLGPCIPWVVPTSHVLLVSPGMRFRALVNMPNAGIARRALDSEL